MILNNNNPILPVQAPAKNPLQQYILHGTTTLAFKYSSGIVVAADSRASMGSFIGSNTVQKIIKVNSRILGTMAGGAADCSFFLRHLTKIIKLYELRNSNTITVANASKILADIIYRYKGYGLSIGSMLAGTNNTDSNDSSNLDMYYVDNDGNRLSNNLFSVGSGSTYAYSILDSCIKAHFNNNNKSNDLTFLEEDKAIKLATDAIFHATHRDAYSGGIINVYIINNYYKGYKLVYRNDMNTIYYNEIMVNNIAKQVQNSKDEIKEEKEEKIH